MFLLSNPHVTPPSSLPWLLELSTGLARSASVGEGIGVGLSGSMAFCLIVQNVDSSSNNCPFCWLSQGSKIAMREEYRLNIVAHSTLDTR